MAEIKRILLITTGTGTSNDTKKIESLAHGLYESVKSVRPDLTVFFGSKESEKTYLAVLKIYEENNRSHINTTEFVTIDSIDSFLVIYKTMLKKYLQLIKQYPENEIIINYTSGTKSMSIAAAILGLLFKRKILLVAGERTQGTVQMGTEEIQEQNLYIAYDYVELQRAVSQFNSFHYQDAKNTFSTIKSLNKKPDLLADLQNLCEIFHLWDKFYRNEAILKINEIKKDKDIDNYLSNIKRFVNTPIRDKTKKTEMKNQASFKIIIELIQNAERRLLEGKFDDATARMYRIAELIGQTILKEIYELDTSDIDIEKIKTLLKDRPNHKPFIEEYENKLKMANSKNDKIKIGLFENYDLIRVLIGESETPLQTNQKFRDLIQKRNKSILAHGLEPIEQKNASDLLELIKKFAEEFWNRYQITPAFYECLNWAKYPTLDLESLTLKIFSDLLN